MEPRREKQRELEFRGAVRALGTGVTKLVQGLGFPGFSVRDTVRARAAIDITPDHP